MLTNHEEDSYIQEDINALAEHSNFSFLCVYLLNFTVHVYRTDGRFFYPFFILRTAFGLPINSLQ